MDIEGFILVGGASSRMGRDKARLALGGRSFVERIAEALSQVSGRVNLVGAKNVDSSLKIGNVPDVYKEWGALGGLHAALDACRAEWAAVVACDLPFVTRELFERLALLGEDRQAVVPVQRDGRMQPLCALYRAVACREVARTMIEEGERRPRALVERVRARLVPWAELEDLAGAHLFFENVNTPEDYAAALSRFGEA
ncbi:MAG TPA: molybdenum cofactor guanylyltransferase [Pyrinomonadaceae bacterium]|nr:molybdenum cofactor guanylyltransferase [Pyrinomonadaceae bacterium]